MEKVPKKTSRFVFIIILLVCILTILIRTQTGKQATIPAYFLANEAYRTGDFKLALERFYDSLKENPGLIRKDPLVRFKIGHSFYKTENFDNAIAVFEKGRSELKRIEDYLYYFELLSYLNMGDTLNAYIHMKTLYRDFRDSPLIPLVDSIKAHVALKKEMPDTALKYLRRTLEKGRFEKTQIYLNMLKVFQMFFREC